MDEDEEVDGVQDAGYVGAAITCHYIGNQRQALLAVLQAFASYRILVPSTTPPACGQSSKSKRSRLR